MSSFWAIERNKKRYMETERLLACDFGRILYLPSYVVPVYWLTNTVTEERDRETVFDNDHSVGEGRGNLQRFLIMILLQEREGEISNGFNYYSVAGEGREEICNGFNYYPVA